MKGVKWIGQALTWAGIAAVVGALGQGPGFSPHGDTRAQLGFSVAHLSQRLVPCRQLTAAERAELPPTRRVQEVCERGRAPTRVILDIDGETRLDRTIKPAGLSDDGRSYLMTRIPIEPGQRALAVRVFDSADPDSPDHMRRFTARIPAGRVALLEVGDEGISLSLQERAEASDA